MSRQGRARPCRKKCCWTPLGVCAKSGNCECHWGSDAAQSQQDIAEAISLEQARLERSRQRRKEPTWTRH